MFEADQVRCVGWSLVGFPARGFGVLSQIGFASTRI